MPRSMPVRGHLTTIPHRNYRRMFFFTVTVNSGLDATAFCPPSVHVSLTECNPLIKCKKKSKKTTWNRQPDREDQEGMFAMETILAVYHKPITGYAWRHNACGHVNTKVCAY